MDSVPNRDVKIIMGDFNAKVGKLRNNKPSCGKFGLGDEIKTSFNNENNVKIFNSFEPLLKLDKEKSPNDIWQEGKGIILCVAKKHFSKKG